jgi:4-alpha-glucanotransferase
VITPDVEELRDSNGFPGMKILQFAFDAKETNNHLPHNYVRNSIVYTGTHDNNTVLGWYESASAEDRDLLLDYLGSDDSGISWKMIRLAFATVADLAVIPAQDLLGLGAEARMNLPGTTSGNWKWRAKTTDFTDTLAGKLAHITKLYGRG